MSDRTFIIAEAGVNHNGDPAQAVRLVDAAADGGADAVKFQTFRAAALATAAAAKADYQQRTTDDATQQDMLSRLELDEPGHRAARARAAERGIEFMSSPFDIESLHMLERLGVLRLKIPSGELTNGPLLLAAARSGLPLIVSTGMATLADIEAALALLAFGVASPDDDPADADLQYTPAAAAQLTARVSLLHCTSEYPAPPDELHLRAIPLLQERYGLTIGYSDHTAGTAVAVAAVALGARIIEKHLTLDRNLPGPDHQASLEPRDMAAMVSAIREVELALGTAAKQPGAAELRNAAVARKSLVALQPVRAGEAFTTANLGIKRPGTGRSPMDFWGLLGTPAPRDYAADELIGE